MCRFRIERYYGKENNYRFTVYVEDSYLKRYYPKHYREIMKDSSCVGVVSNNGGTFYSQMIITDLWKTY